MPVATWNYEHHRMNKHCGSEPSRLQVDSAIVTSCGFLFHLLSGPCSCFVVYYTQTTFHFAQHTHSQSSLKGEKVMREFSLMLILQKCSPATFQGVKVQSPSTTDNRTNMYTQYTSRYTSGRDFTSHIISHLLK